MQPSECCIFRGSVAAILGAIIGCIYLWEHGALVALLLSPFFGSAMAIGAFGLFHLVSRASPDGSAIGVSTPPVEQ